MSGDSVTENVQPSSLVEIVPPITPARLDAGPALQKMGLLDLIPPAVRASITNSPPLSLSQLGENLLKIAGSAEKNKSGGGRLDKVETIGMMLTSLKSEELEQAQKILTESKSPQQAQEELIKLYAKHIAASQKEADSSVAGKIDEADLVKHLKNMLTQPDFKPEVLFNQFCRDPVGTVKQVGAKLAFEIKEKAPTAVSSVAFVGGFLLLFVFLQKLMKGEKEAAGIMPGM